MTSGYGTGGGGVTTRRATVTTDVVPDWKNVGCAPEVLSTPPGRLANTPSSRRGGGHW